MSRRSRSCTTPPAEAGYGCSVFSGGTMGSSAAACVDIRQATAQIAKAVCRNVFMSHLAISKCADLLSACERHKRRAAAARLNSALGTATATYTQILVCHG